MDCVTASTVSVATFGDKQPALIPSSFYHLFCCALTGCYVTLALLRGLCKQIGLVMYVAVLYVWYQFDIRCLHASGALPFQLQPGREGGEAEAKRTRHLGPGAYTVR